ncbi:MAG: HEAT repeat domain-containing protein [Candidatus Latescibacteria bacterium]|nr:HEAT repeat domain-containing protein [Candidatus Latescibacterota bacterium]
MRTTYLFFSLLLLTCCPGCGDEVDQAINDMGKSPKKVRDAQMELILTSKDPMPRLIEALEDEGRSKTARMNLIETAGKLSQRTGGRRAQDVLMATLSDPDKDVKIGAMSALSAMEMDSTSAVAIQPLLNDEDLEVRRKADEALDDGVKELVEKALGLARMEKNDEAENLFVQATAYNPRSGKARYALARFYDDIGRAEEAQKLLKALHFVRDWWVIGPFDAPDRRGFKITYPPEKAVKLKQSYPGKSNKLVRWVRHQIPENTGVLDFKDVWTEDNDDAAGFAFCTLYSPDERRARILLGSDDTINLWLNGKEVLAKDVYRGTHPDDDKVDVTLRKGANRLLAKVCNGSGGWGLALRLTDPDGNAMEDVAYRVPEVNE